MGLFYQDLELRLPYIVGIQKLFYEQVNTCNESEEEAEHLI